MDENQLCAIMSSIPADLTDREEFGKALARQGEPLGEFIQVQCKFEQFRRTFPSRFRSSGWQDPPEVDALYQRARELEKQYAKEWTAPLRRFGIADVVFSAGVVDSLLVTDPMTFAKNIESVIRIVPTAKTLLFSFPSEDASVAAQGKAIRALSANPALAHFDALEFTFWDGNEIASAVAAAPHVGGLKRLFLADCNLGPNGAEAILRSRRLASLEWLDLSHNPRLGVDGAQAVRLSSLPALKTLGLQNTGIDDSAAAALRGAGMLRSLRRLDISDNPLSPDAIHALLDAPALRRVAVQVSTEHLPAAAARALRDKVNAHNSSGQGADPGGL